MTVPKKIMAAAKEKAANLWAAGLANVPGDLVIVKSGRDYILLNVAGPGSENLSRGGYLSTAEAFRISWLEAVFSGRARRVEL